MDLTVRQWLFELEVVGIKLGLDPMRAMLDRLGRPDKTFVAVTVAGTNGKGSVAAVIERGLRASGRRTGRYTSPHLTHIEERIVIDGRPIDAAAFDRAGARVHDAAQALSSPPSFFEATTALALVAFRDAGVETAVLEVGLGGRLDATNVVDAPLAVITNIGLDHQAYLGDTIEAIAAEKAGVIKAGATVVVGQTRARALDVIAAIAARAGASLVYAPDGVVAPAAVGRRFSDVTLTTPHSRYGTLRLNVPGRHQVDNAVTAVRALEEAGRLGFAPVSHAAVRLAIEDVQWAGRLEWRRWRHCDVLVDGAHNPDGARALVAYLAETTCERVPMVFGMMRDKHIADVIAILAPCASAFIVTASGSPRAAKPSQLAQIVATMAPAAPCVIAQSPEEALGHAVLMGSPVVVAGSLFLAGDVLLLCA